MNTKRIAFGTLALAALACNYVTQIIAPPTATPIPTATPLPTLTATPRPTATTIPLPASTLSDLDALIAAAQAEGTLNVIALPHDWCNYGEIIQVFKNKYDLQVNEINPDAGSSDQIDAIKANNAQSPDVIDIGLAWANSSKQEGLLTPYKVSAWDSIPDELKDADGYWYGNYYGVMSFLVNTDVQPNIPQDWNDLLKPEYKGQVALSGDPHTSTQGASSVLAAALASGGSLDDARPGLDFFAQLHQAGNLIPKISNNGLFASGETPVRIGWDYNMREFTDGAPNAELILPANGRLGVMFAEAISAQAAHPSAAKLWMEFLYSDEGQALWMKGYCHPVRGADLFERGQVSADLGAKMPHPSGVVFATPEQLQAARDFIAGNWDAIVGVDLQR